LGGSEADFLLPCPQTEMLFSQSESTTHQRFIHWMPVVTLLVTSYG
jgi:hypothetical protein